MAISTEPMMRTGIWIACWLLAAYPATAAEFDWLAGRWCGTLGDDRIEEWWTPSAGGELLGVGRTLRDGRMVAFEYLRIVRDDGGIAYVAQPGGRPPTRFAFEAADTSSVSFANPDHDFPQRISYRRDGERLQAEISGTVAGGRVQRIAYRFARCEP